MKIPIKISPFFFVTAALIGWINSSQTSHPFILTLIWIGVIFVSILVHEYGHALTSRYFGQKPWIQLGAFGGLTYPEGPRLRGWREFLVVLNGPVFGFLLFLLYLFLLSTEFFENPYILYTVKIFTWVNLFWTIVNLLPVIPMDGGQLLRIVMESIFGAKGLKYAIFTSMLLSCAFSIFFFFIGYFLVGAIFFLFAFQNFDAWRKSRVMTESDRSGEITKEMKEIEDLLNDNQKGAAISKLKEIRTKAKQGMVYNLTTQYLAAIKAEREEYQEVYDLLLPIKKYLSPESKLFLHRAAYEVKDYPLVVELGGPSFQLLPDPKIALNNAEACAALAQAEPAIGWLYAAHKGGIKNLESILSKEVFDLIRETEGFKKLLHH
ncbi:MAG: site-2 protease family protein [Candidatus Neptunochlamydia sp.]|nr:site-2 protease family protein [Candidatus Neptunochlamydia sp.]